MCIRLRFKPQENKQTPKMSIGGPGDVELGDILFSDTWRDPSSTENAQSMAAATIDGHHISSPIHDNVAASASVKSEEQASVIAALYSHIELQRVYIEKQRLELRTEIEQ